MFTTASAPPPLLEVIDNFLKEGYVKVVVDYAENVGFTAKVFSFWFGFAGGFIPRLVIPRHLLGNITADFSEKHGLNKGVTAPIHLGRCAGGFRQNRPAEDEIDELA